MRSFSVVRFRQIAIARRALSALRPGSTSRFGSSSRRFNTAHRLADETFFDSAPLRDRNKSRRIPKSRRRNESRGRISREIFARPSAAAARPRKCRGASCGNGGTIVHFAKRLIENRHARKNRRASSARDRPAPRAACDRGSPPTARRGRSAA